LTSTFSEVRENQTVVMSITSRYSVVNRFNYTAYFTEYLLL
jgi:hypothetical protein